MVIISKYLSHKIILNNDEITSFLEQKLLRNLLDSKLIFESHISSFCSKSGQKKKKKKKKQKKKKKALARFKELPCIRSKELTT